MKFLFKQTVNKLKSSPKNKRQAWSDVWNRSTSTHCVYHHTLSFKSSQIIHFAFPGINALNNLQLSFCLHHGSKYTLLSDMLVLQLWFLITRLNFCFDDCWFRALLLDCQLRLVHIKSRQLLTDQLKHTLEMIYK